MLSANTENQIVKLCKHSLLLVADKTTTKKAETVAEQLESLTLTLLANRLPASQYSTVHIPALS